MPELPEVECLARAVRSVAKGGAIARAKFYRADLRGPIPVQIIEEVLVGREILDVSRRSKYLLLHTDAGFGVIHLGMSGQLLSSQSPLPELPHTHAVLELKDRKGATTFLHYVDPRRFGQIAAFAGRSLMDSEMFSDLGPEPLQKFALGEHLWRASRGKKQTVKAFIMDASVVVGVGNIYASEALFRSGIRPSRRAGSIVRHDYETLALRIRETLKDAIKAGGTTFRDYRHADGTPGYFAVSLSVYDREGLPCPCCGQPISEKRIAGRSSFFCRNCQK